MSAHLTTPTGSIAATVAPILARAAHIQLTVKAAGKVRCFLCNRGLDDDWIITPYARCNGNKKFPSNEFVSKLIEQVK